MVLELIGMGMFRDETGRIDDSRILEMLEFGDYNVSMDSKRLEKIKSNEQNIKMSMGEPQAVEFYELHNVAVETHTEYMLSSEFDVLDPQIKQIIHATLTRTHYVYSTSTNATNASTNATRAKRKKTSKYK